MIAKRMHYKMYRLDIPPEERNWLAQKRRAWVIYVIGWRVAVTLVRDGTFGRICKSAPTSFINLMARGGWGCARTTRCGRACGAVEKVPSCIVGGNCLVQNHHNHPVRLRLPPLQRRGMVRPYQFRKFNGAKRLSLFDEDTFSTAPNGLFVQTHRVGWFTGLCGAERLGLCKDNALGRIYKSAPTILWNVCLIEGAGTAGHAKAVGIVSFAYGLAPAVGGA